MLNDTPNINYILQANSLTKEFRGFSAVKQVNLNIEQGKIHTLIGPNGAGKTTVFNMLTKAMNPTSGTIVFNGEDITTLSPAIVACKGLVRSFQISATFPHLSVLENVRIALQRRDNTNFCFWQNERILQKHHSKAMELISLVGLENHTHKKAIELPYGKKRALEIATTLATEPKLMLLDEPTQGMGHEDIDATTSLIKKVSQGRTILMVEHNLRVVESLADTITVLQRGEILVEGNYETVSQNPDVRSAYMGSADSTNKVIKKAI